MQIQVDHKFRLSTTKSGWSVQQLRPLVKGPRTGQVEWADEGHYDTLQWALVGLWRLMLHEGHGQATLPQLAARVDEVERRVMELGDKLSPKIPSLDSMQPGKRISDVRELSPWDRTA